MFAVIEIYDGIPFIVFKGEYEECRNFIKELSGEDTDEVELDECLYIIKPV